ncbi:MAG TPA: NADH-quinone oxidoreductase subunit M [Ferruginibacter sp.]|nr:NADH-quinone oxidoreductase subunit M [Ferruginibacter sp.]HMP22278.1 NADH-quinone oxidoreductase subunit M [Ferruginibacter sp.]
MNLIVLLLIPFITALLVLLARTTQQVRLAALAGSAVQLVAAIILLFAFNHEKAAGNTAAIFFEQNHSWFPAWNISFHIGIDGIAMAMILLTAFVVIAGVLVSWKIEKMVKEFYAMLILLSLGAYGFFISLDLFSMFFFLELAVIPKYLLIGIWGSGKKEYAANKLALMLMCGSALVLVGMLGAYFGSDAKTFDITILAASPLAKDVQLLCFPFLFIGFGIFTALFPFHTWVPDGHSSAPTAGSMFLAGISMKLGGYGCLRAAAYLMPDAAQAYSPYIILLAAIAIIYGAFATMMQQDLKYINAYSSISHCGFVLLGIGMLTQAAITGAVMQMVSHGLMTALFFAVIGMIYERTHTRDVAAMGGLMKSMPFICTVLFLVGFCSLGLPGLSGFAAEMMVFTGSWQQPGIFHRIATVAACLSIVVTAVYILRAVGKVAMGPLKAGASALSDAGWHEKLAALVLLAGILAMGLAPEWLNTLVSPGSQIIMQKIQAVK